MIITAFGHAVEITDASLLSALTWARGAHNAQLPETVREGEGDDAEDVPNPERDSTDAAHLLRVLANGRLAGSTPTAEQIADEARRVMLSWCPLAGIDVPVDPPGPDEAKARLVAYAASRRYVAEIAGCLDPDGRAIATDRDSQTKLIAEMVAIGAGLRTDPSGWKLRGNGFALLTNAEMQAAIIAARSHISAAFAVEAAVLAGIAADAITTTAEIDAANWPA